MAASPSAVRIIFIMFTFFFQDAMVAKYTSMVFLKEILINVVESYWLCEYSLLWLS